MEKQSQEIQKKTSGNPLKPKTLLIASLGCLVVAFFCLLIPTLLTALQNADDTSYLTRLFTMNLGSAINFVWVSLLMPVSLLLLASNTEKAKLSKIFMLVGAILVVVQLLSSLIAAVCLLVEELAYSDNYYSNSYSRSVFYAIELLISSVNGKNLLTTPLSFLINLFDGGFGGFLNFLVALISTILRTVAALLVILSNAVCTFGCFLVGAKKKESAKEETEAPVEA